MGIVNDTDTLHDWASLAGYVATGGVPDEQGNFIGSANHAAKILDVLLTEGQPLSVQVGRYLGEPIAITILLKKAGLVN